jgi:hypothetical protein
LHFKQLDSLVRSQDLFCYQPNLKTIRLTLIDREVGSTRKIEFKLQRVLKEISAIFYFSIKRFFQLPITTREALIFCEAYLKANPNIKMTRKELFLALVPEINRFFIKRKSHHKIAHLLPKELFKF